MLLPVEPGVGEGRLHQLANRVHLSRPDHEIIGALRLKDLPHTLHVLGSVAPVPLRIKIPEKYFVGTLGHDGRDTARDLTADEGLTAAGRLVVEQNAVAGEHPVRLTVVGRHPVRICLGGCVRTAGVKGRSEEHTSELQSPCNLVCRLLLEKKKKKTKLTLTARADIGVHV